MNKPTKMSYKNTDDQSQIDQTNYGTFDGTTLNPSFIDFLNGKDNDVRKNKSTVKSKNNNDLKPPQSIEDFIKTIETAKTNTNHMNVIEDNSQALNKLNPGGDEYHNDLKNESRSSKSTKLKAQPLKSQQEIIKELQDEVLELKVQNFQLKNSKDPINGSESSDANKKLLNSLIQENRDLKNKLDHKRSKYKNVQIQTHLDGYGMEELWKARLFERKYKEEQQILKRNEKLQRQEQTAARTLDNNSGKPEPVVSKKLNEFASSHPKPFPQKSSSHQDLAGITRHANITAQLTFRDSNLDETFINNKQPMSSKEKKILEDLFRVDGLMTTTLDKLRLKSESQGLR